MENIEITRREIMVSVIIFFVLLSLGFLISNFIIEKKIIEIEKYNKALKINNDNDLFAYSVETEVGDILAYGRFSIDSGVSFDELKDEYTYIRKETERYTKHSEEVCDTDSDGHRHCHTEYYYSWDNIDVEAKSVSNIKFMKTNYDYGLFSNYPVYTLDIASNIVDNKKRNVNGVYLYEKNTFWTSEGDIRYIYYYTPKVFTGTIFAKATKKTIMNVNGSGTININLTDLETTLKDKKNSTTIINIVFWIIWLIIIGLAIYGFVYMENDYLED